MSPGTPACRQATGSDVAVQPARNRLRSACNGGSVGRRGTTWPNVPECNDGHVVCVHTSLERRTPPATTRLHASALADGPSIRPIIVLRPAPPAPYTPAPRSVATGDFRITGAQQCAIRAHRGTRWDGVWWGWSGVIASLVQTWRTSRSIPSCTPVGGHRSWHESTAVDMYVDNHRVAPRC